MRIGITARGLSERSGGAKQYIDSLISSLLEIDRANEYFLFYDSPSHLGRYPSAKEIYLRIPSKLLWDHLGVPYLTRKYGIDVLFCPKNVVPNLVRCKTVVAVLDLTHFKFPKEYRWTDKCYMRLFVPSSVKKADMVIAISQNTRRDIIQTFDIEPDKVVAIPLAPDKKYRQITDENLKKEVRERYGLYSPYIFFPGALSPRKNIVTLVKALGEIKDKIPHKLVFTAGKSWKDSVVYKTIKELGLSDRVVTLGHVKDSDMPVLYAIADLLVYPSIYEGFGLPAIEAMACGCPVISSNSSSLPEVVEDSAITVDAMDVKGLSDAICRVLTDGVLREELIRKGFVQAGKFSWERTAGETLAIFKEVQL